MYMLSRVPEKCVEKRNLLLFFCSSKFWTFDIRHQQKTFLKFFYRTDILSLFFENMFFAGFEKKKDNGLSH